MPHSLDAIAEATTSRVTAAHAEQSTRDAQSLEEACRQTASRLAPSLGADCRLLVRAPYVLGGDLPEAALERHLSETILPTARALSTLYFDRQPDQPIVLLLFSTESSYRQHAEKLDGRERPNYSGYYQRSDRRIVLNISTGRGTLAHELTHALAHFDFPDMPEWFDEGLASLGEESEFSDDGLRLTGISNWRLNYILPELRQNRLRPLQSLIVSGNVRPGYEAVDYAHARYFCLYLQQRQLLGPYYRKFRARVAGDPSGLETLRELLGADSLDAVDRDFRAWLIALAPAARR